MLLDLDSYMHPSGQRKKIKLILFGKFVYNFPLIKTVAAKKKVNSEKKGESSQINCAAISTEF
jgi:hypothetical protein